MSDGIAASELIATVLALLVTHHTSKDIRELPTHTKHLKFHKAPWWHKQAVWPPGLAYTVFPHPSVTLTF